jgi:hypothetical protein
MVFVFVCLFFFFFSSGESIGRNSEDKMALSSWDYDSHNGTSYRALS